MSSEEDMPPVPPSNTTMVITSNTVYIQRPDTFLDRHSKVFDNGSKVYLTQNVSLINRRAMGISYETRTHKSLSFRDI